MTEDFEMLGAKMSAKKRGNVDLSRLEYAKAINKVIKLMRQAKRKFESDVADKAKTNPKAFWCHVNSKLKTKVSVSHLLTKRWQIS